MKSFVIFILCIQYSLNEEQFLQVTPNPTDSDIFEPSDGATQLGNNGIERADVLVNEISSQINSAPTFESFFKTTEVSTENMTHEVSTSMEIFANESQPLESSSVATEEATSLYSVAPSNQGVNESTAVTDGDDDGELEGVARGKPSSTESDNITLTTAAETLYQKTLALISDTYTLSIIIPIAAGIVFASTIIVIIATCRCIRRRCRRRRLRRKALPDSVKSLRPSDRARLLAESSDEEF